jgi:hypothetical protein
MENFDLLEYVQPQEGWFCILGLDSSGRPNQTLVATREEVDAVVKKFVARKLDVYFGVAKFITDENRKQDNVLSLKAFWLDIDCGPAKAEIDPKTGRPAGYISQAAGADKLKEFCTAVGLPQPTIVNSGRGLHVYWTLDTVISPTQWKPVADRFRQLCDEHKFYVDYNVFETARVLRVPGTPNFKDNSPKIVTVLHVAPVMSFDAFRNIVGVSEIKLMPSAKPKKLSALGKALMENMGSNFGKIMLRSAKGDGCAQLLSCYTEREALSEPRWFDALSVAKFCSDADVAIHRLSSDHPDYDPSEVEKKISHIVGPHTCDVFERNNVGGCDGCPYKGKIKSPISLGREILRHDESAGEEAALPAGDTASEDTDDDYDGIDIDGKERCAAPYFRGKNGGIYVQLDDDDEPRLVYEHDFFVVKRMSDPLLGDVAVFRLYAPKDGKKTFTVPNAKISQVLEFRRELAKHGILGSEAQFKLINAYVIHALKELQFKRKAEVMRRQFGWADGDTKFIVGEREITKDGVYHSPPSSITESIAPYLQSAGDLELWKEVFSLYGKEGLEIQAFGALTGFGAPLLKFTGQKGAIINMIHRYAGTGKTTILRMANSVCGHPEELLGNSEDTKVARITKVGILNNIINTVDEITNLDAKTFSDLVYAYSQGKGKDKGDPHENKLRLNNTTWRTPTLTSSNASFYDKMGALKTTADGEIMRLLEFKVEYTGTDVISTAHGKKMFDHQLNENYGLAIVPYIQFILCNMDEVLATLQRVQDKIDRELNLTSRERNWSAMAAANLTGGLIAERVGLLVGWDMARLYKVVTDKLQEMRALTKAPVNNVSAVVGDYIYRHINNILVVDEGADKRTHLPMAPLVEPRGELLIRYEPDTKRMFIAITAFRKDCVDFQVDYTETVKELKEKGLLVEIMNKRLSKGMSVASAGVRCLVLDCDNSEFIDVDSLVAAKPAETTDGSGISKV